MLKVSCLLLSLFILLDSSDCDPQKQGERINSLEADVKQLKTEVAVLNQKGAPALDHHYELRKEGLRTWRFDPANGDLCIELTSTDDWKRKETKAESCSCTDAMQHWTEMPTDSDQQQKSSENYYNRVVASDCGN